MTRRQISKVVRYLPDKKKFRLAVQLSVLRGSRPKSARASLLECAQWSRFHPNRFTFGGVIPERVNTVKTRRKVNPIFGWSVASRRIMMELHRHRNLEKFVRIVCKLLQNLVKFIAFAVPTLPQPGWGWILAGWIDRMVRLAGWVGLNPIIVMSPSSPLLLQRGYKGTVLHYLSYL